MWDLIGYGLLVLILFTLLAHALHYHMILVVQDYNRFRYGQRTGQIKWEDNHVWDERNLPLTKIHVRIKEFFLNLKEKIRSIIEGFK
ncbi:MAG: hypothetical protein CL398_00020 [Acidiferrobacteraceae bacterium]|nr:hypothetical protein [Acidiferrobacteraceae bacterium]